MTDDLTKALAVGRDDTRRFSVTLIDLKKAYNNALAADVDVVSAMWMNLSMDCAKVSNDLIPRADADLAELAAFRAQVERLRAAAEPLGAWLSAALDDPKPCAEMKRDINAWFAALTEGAAPDGPGVL